MYDIFLISQNKISSKKWNLFKKKYPTAQKIENIQSIQEIRKKTFTKMFWVIWDNLEIVDNFDLHKYKISKWDEKYIHCFLNKETGYVGGLILCPKNVQITDKEFADRYYINKKEIELTVSEFVRYDKFIIKNYNDYLTALDTSVSNLFWGVWDNIEITDTSIFNFVIDEFNDHEQNENHCFKNLFKGQSTYKNGLILFSKTKSVSKREIDNRFLIEKKEHDKIVSKFKPYEIVFISYNEPNADDNFQKLIERYPRAKRIHGVKGIHQAHIEAAKKVSTEMFWVVDGDSEIVDDFNFDYEVEEWEKSSVFVWRSRNPINDLEYGYGGVKLLPRQLTIDMDTTTKDMTTSIGKYFIVKNEISNVTNFATDPFNTWKSAFRECVKLSSALIPGQNNEETNHRLEIWQTQSHEHQFAKFAISGAKAGAEYGKKYQHDSEALNRINDFTWLRTKFENEFVV